MKKKTLSSLIISFLCIQFVSFAASGEQLNLKIDNDHTHVVWKVERFGFTNTIGTFRTVNGTIQLDLENLENSTIESTIKVSGIRSDLKERENIIKSEFWLHAKKFPAIEFTSTSIQKTDQPGCNNTCVLITGNATIKGVTKSIEMIGQINKVGIDPPSKKKAAGFTLIGSVKRSDFGIDMAQNFIGDEVSFEVYAVGLAH